VEAAMDRVSEDDVVDGAVEVELEAVEEVAM
jgi:hypothetical protein